MGEWDWRKELIGVEWSSSWVVEESKDFQSI